MIEIVDISEKNLSKFENLIGVFKNQFSPQNIWLGAIANNFPCGVVLSEEDLDDIDTCDISMFFVPEPIRNEGIEKSLFEELLRRIKQKGYKKIIFNSVVDDKEFLELKKFLKNYGFSPLEIVADTYIFNDLESLLNNKNIQRAINREFVLPKGIEILPLNEVSQILLDKIKKEINVKYPDYYAIFPTDIAKNLKHINTFVAIANKKEIIGWLTGLDVYGANIFYKTFFVNDKFRNLGIGFYLMNFCIKNQALKYKNTPAMCGISNKNSFAKKFNETFFCGVKKTIRHEVISKKNIF